MRANEPGNAATSRNDPPITVPLVSAGAAAGPRLGRDGDAGVDLTANTDLILAPNERATIGTGISIALPPGHVGLVCPRSGLASRHGITVVNAPGIVDAGYRGEIKVTLLNTDATSPFAIARGDRIAQLVVQRFVAVGFVEVPALPDSERGTRGHGSSGGFGGRC